MFMLQLLVMAVLTMIAKAERNEHSSVVSKISDKRFDGNVLQTLRVISERECNGFCLRKSGCKSGNVRPDGDGWMTCELLIVNEAQMPQLIDEPGSMFFGKPDIFHLVLSICRPINLSPSSRIFITFILKQRASSKSPLDNQTL